MAIPEMEMFEQFLRGTSVVDRPPSGPHVRFPTPDGGGVLYLAYPAADITLDAVLKRIGDELRGSGCPSNSEIALAVLGNLVATWGEGEGSAVAHLNACLSETHDVQLQQHFVMPDPCRSGYEMVIEEFSIRPFDPSKIRYWADRAKVSFPHDLSGLAGKIALERQRFETRLVHWDKIDATCSARVARPERAVATRDAYYGAVANYFTSRVEEALASRLLVFESGGLLHFDTKSFLHGLLSQHIGLFQWTFGEKHRAWAVYSSVSLLQRNLPPRELLPKCREWIQSETGFRKLDPDKALDRTIETFCVFLRRAHGHRLSRRYDEALLHFVVALDLLFGMQGKSTDSVATRAAVIAHRPLGRTLVEQASLLKKAYDARSKYVHEGKSPPPECVVEAEKAATQVLWALLAVSARNDLEKLSDWLERIDLIAAALKLGRSVPEDELAVGMSTGDRKREAPIRVSEDAEIDLPEHLTGIRLVR